jgi:hypothetical protein
VKRKIITEFIYLLYLEIPDARQYTLFLFLVGSPLFTLGSSLVGGTTLSSIVLGGSLFATWAGHFIGGGVNDVTGAGVGEGATTLPSSKTQSLGMIAVVESSTVLFERSKRKHVRM